MTTNQRRHNSSVSLTARVTTSINVALADPVHQLTVCHPPQANVASGVRSLGVLPRTQDAAYILLTIGLNLSLNGVSHIIRSRAVLLTASLLSINLFSAIVHACFMPRHASFAVNLFFGFSVSTPPEGRGKPDDAMTLHHCSGSTGLEPPCWASTWKCIHFSARRSDERERKP